MELRLDECCLITDDAVVAVGMNCSRLTGLSLRCCSGIGNRALNAIAENCGNIKFLDISWCTLCTDDGYLIFICYNKVVQQNI